MPFCRNILELSSYYWWIFDTENLHDFQRFVRTVSYSQSYNTPFLLAALFFHSASVLLNFFMNQASNVVTVLLNTSDHHYTETHSAYLYQCLDLDLSMSYLYDLFFIFSLFIIVILGPHLNRRTCFLYNF